MAKTLATANSAKGKTGFQHVALWLVMVAVLFFVLFFQAIPVLVSSFVVPLFKPSGDELEKVGFVQFEGLVYATTSKDKEPLYQGKNVEVSKEAINGEYIFDFTFVPRNDDEHGYVKGQWEFYSRSPLLGEHAIILEPWIAFSVIALVLAVAIASLVTMVLPSSIGILAAMFERQIDNTKIKIRLQTGFADSIVELLTMPDDKLPEVDRSKVEKAFRRVCDRTVSDAEMSSRQSIPFDDLYEDDTDVVAFRNQALLSRIKEYFSEFVVIEIEDTKEGLMWKKNHLLFWKGLRLYMAHHFTEKYANNVTGAAYAGAAFLIVAVGIRGLKFIPAARPSFIMLAIFLEFTMLSLLAVTLFYTEEEERMDKMLKKMEDASKSQLETLKGSQEDIHQLANALVGQTSEIIRTRVENAISDYMTSGDQVQKQIAEEIAKKITFNLRSAEPEERRR